jgi:hypothetical protein
VPTLADLRSATWEAVHEAIQRTHATGSMDAHLLDLERAQVLAQATDMEILNLLIHCVELAPGHTREAVEIIYRLQARERSDAPVADGSQWRSSPHNRDRFRSTFPVSATGGQLLAKALEKAGGITQLAKVWAIEEGNISRRATAILRRHPGDPALDDLAVWAVIWEAQRGAGAGTASTTES